MADEEKNEKRISTQEAISGIAAAVVKLSSRLDDHSKRLANHDDALGAMAKLCDTLRAALDAQQKIFEGLQRAVAEKTGERLPSRGR